MFKGMVCYALVCRGGANLAGSGGARLGLIIKEAER
jgi:hypothetical protein